MYVVNLSLSIILHGCVHMKATEQDFHMVLFVLNLALTCEILDEIVW